MNLIGGTGYWYKSYFGFWRPNGVVNGPWEWTDGTAVTFNAMPASENDNNAHYAKIADHSTQWKTESAGGIQRAVYKRKRFPHISNINEVKITGKGIDISGNNSIIINDTSGIKLNDVFSVNASQIDISCTMNQFGNISSNAIYTRGTEIYLTDACGNGGLTWFSGENEFSEYEYAFYNGVPSSTYGSTRRERHINLARSLGGDLASIHSHAENEFLGHKNYQGERWIGLSRPGGENTTLEWSDGTPVNYQPNLYDGHRQYFYFRRSDNVDWAGTNNLDDSSPDGAVYKRKKFINNNNANTTSSNNRNHNSIILKRDIESNEDFSATVLYGNAWVGNDANNLLTWVPGTPGSSFEDYEYAYKTDYVNWQDVGYVHTSPFYRFLYQARHLGGDLASIHSQEEYDFIMNLIGGTGYWYYAYFGFWRPNGTINGPWEWTDGTPVTFNAMPASENDNNGHYAKIAYNSTQWQTDNPGGGKRAVYKRKRYVKQLTHKSLNITDNTIDICGNNSLIISDENGINLNNKIMLHPNGNIDFSGSLYKDGVEITAGGGGGGGGGGGTSSSLIGPFKLISTGNLNEDTWGHFQFERKMASTDYGAIGFDAGSSAGGGNVAEAICIKRTGEVGIGTTNPICRFTVGNNATSNTGGSNSMAILAPGENADAILYFGTQHENNANNTGIGKAAIIAEGKTTYSRSNLHFCLNTEANNNVSASLSDSKMTILNEGNVGIGFTTPSYKLSLGTSFDSDPNNARIALYEGSAAHGGKHFYGLGIIAPSGNEPGLALWGGTSNELPTESNVDVMISRNGNVGIGDTTPVISLMLLETLISPEIYIKMVLHLVAVAVAHGQIWW